MNPKNLYWIVSLCLIVGIVLGMYLAFFVETRQVGESKLYNCVYNNLQSNNFPQNPIMIKEIENECICFREHNFTNLLEVNCSNYSFVEDQNTTKNARGKDGK